MKKFFLYIFHKWANTKYTAYLCIVYLTLVVFLPPATSVGVLFISMQLLSVAFYFSALLWCVGTLLEWDKENVG